MKEQSKTMYQCDHCLKWYMRRHACEKHELRCKKNPANFRPCFGCKHLVKKYGDVYFDSYMLEEQIEKRHLLYCQKKEHFVCPPISEIKGYWYDTGDGDDYNRPMPKSCELREAAYLIQDEPAYL